MNEAIKNICHALIKEAEAVKSHTFGIENLEMVHGAEETVKTLQLSRLDNVEHIQNLTIALTHALSGSIAEGTADA